MHLILLHWSIIIVINIAITLIPIFNIHRKLLIFFLLKSAICQVKLCLWLCAILRWLLVGLTVLGKFVWFFPWYIYFIYYLVTLWSRQSYWSWTIISAKFHEIPRKYQNSAKKADSTARLEIPRPTKNCGPYWSLIGTVIYFILLFFLVSSTLFVVLIQYPYSSFYFHHATTVFLQVF